MYAGNGQANAKVFLFCLCSENICHPVKYLLWKACPFVNTALWVILNWNMHSLISFVILYGRRYTFHKLSLETPELRFFCSDEGGTNLLSTPAWLALACRAATARLGLAVEMTGLLMITYYWHKSQKKDFRLGWKLRQRCFTGTFYQLQLGKPPTKLFIARLLILLSLLSFARTFYTAALRTVFQFFGS